MDGHNPHSTHIIIQEEENPQIFDANQPRGAFIVKVDDGSAVDSLPEKPGLPKLIQASHEGPKSNDTDHTLSFAIIHSDPLSGDTLFDYPVFPQEEGRFNEHSELEKNLSDSPRIIDDSTHTSEKCDMVETNNTLALKPQGTAKATDSSGQSVPLNFESLPQTSEMNAQVGMIKGETANSDSNFSSCQSTLETGGKSKDKDIIKKTTVEAFVKMVVCRKITVQKVNSKTGTVLDVDVHTEEEKPVVLGVDCVETTEDISSSTGSKSDSKVCPGQSTSGTSMDRGLKFLSAVSESRQKINPSLLGSALLQSSLPRSLSKPLHSEKVEYSLEESNSVKTEKTEELTDSLYMKSADILNDLNEDDSADYIPPYEKKLLKKPHSSALIPPKISSRKCSPREASEMDSQDSELPCGLEHEKSGSSILLPKKRGRKRRWDKALGLVSNLKTCQFCNKHFENVKRCAKHMKKGECITALYCYICSKPFDSEDLLEKHILSHGSSPKASSYDCHDCRRSYRTKAGYMKHFRMGTCSKRDEFEDGETGDFPCDICGARFSTMDYLKLHRYKVHENPKDLHNCPDCGKKFHSFLGFQRHRQARPCTEPLKCRICGKTYKAKESFKIHMKHHKSEITGETFDCDSCGRSYMTQTALTKHKLSHTGVKPYKCETCGKEFAMRYQVKDHARMHTGERPYLCSLCGSAFSNKGHLGRHLRSHENGTLLRRGRPKKIRETSENSARDAGLKLIDVAQTLQTIDGQTIQVVDGQMFDSPNNNTPMIIQADNNTIIITEGWHANNAPVSQPVTSIANASND